jgi:hypothetical protein
MHRVVLVSAVAAGLLLALSACGGSSSKSAQATTAETTVTRSTATTTANTNGATTTQATATTSQTTSTGTATSTTTAKAPRLPANECRRLTTLAAKMGQAFTGRTPAADTRAYADFLQQLAKTAPADIRDDFRVLADAYTKIADAVGAIFTKPGATPTPDQLKKLNDVGKDLNQGAITRAAGNVNAWLQQGCRR